MSDPMRATAHNVAHDIDVVTSYFPIPGFGMLPVNAFVLKGTEPMLVDTGLGLDHEGEPASEAFMAALWSVIDPEDLKWVWLTHTDLDHTGSLRRVLEEAPQARVITTFLGVGKMMLQDPLPLDRVYLLNPGESLEVGNRTITAFKPPCFDAPETTGFIDHTSGALFSSDCFGALLESPAETAADIGAAQLREGQILWTTIDSPWLHNIDSRVFISSLEAIRDLAPDVIFSSHLPVARGMNDQLLDALAESPGADPFVGPDQAALQQMLAQMTGDEPAA